MANFNSITYRITGLMFLGIALTVFILLYMANAQMTDLFQQYLMMQHLEMNAVSANTRMMGPHENDF